MRKNHKTTKEDFILYQNEVKRWMLRLSLNDWEAYFFHDRPDVGANQACVILNDETMVAKFYLHPEWQTYEVTTEEIKNLAYHEVTEMLLFPHEVAAKKEATNKGSEEQTMSETHKIINRLRPLLMGE